MKCKCYRYFAVLLLFTVAFLLAQTDPRVFSDADNPRFQVSEIEFPDLNDPSRNNRNVPLKIFYPNEKGVFPLIIISHGAVGSWDSYYVQAKYFAENGYVVVCPEHIFSNQTQANLRMKPYQDLSFERKKEKFKEIVHQMTKDPNALLQRPKDISFVIDRAIEYNKTHPELSGKIDTNHIAVMGHSYGACTVLVICGARPILDYLDPPVAPFHGLGPDLSDERVTIGMAMSPQGIEGTFFGPKSFSTINRPLLCFSGSKDFVKGHSGTMLSAIRRLRGFRRIPKKIDKYFLWLKNADHMSFADAGNKMTMVPSAAREDTQKILKVMTLAFLDSYLKNTGNFNKMLSRDTLSSLCGNVVKSIKIFR